MKRAVSLRLRSASPWEVGIFVQVPLIVVIFYLWQVLSLHGSMQDFHAFRGAAQDALGGASPYPQVDTITIARAEQLVYPPVVAFLFAPFAVLPSSVAVVFYLFVIAAAVPLTVWALGVRDWRLFGVAFLWPTTQTVFGVGALGSLLTLCVALAWRWRNSLWRAAPFLAVAVVAKLFLWPLLVWLVATRRVKTAGATVAIGVGATAVAWAAIGFGGLREYPHLLGKLVDVFGPIAYSPSALAMTLGASRDASRVVILLLAVPLLYGIVRLARDRDGDRRSLTLALGAALLLTPILWLHYLVLLLVPLALARPKLSPLWFLPMALWATYSLEAHGDVWRILLLLSVVVAALGATLHAGSAPRTSESLARPAGEAVA